MDTLRTEIIIVLDRSGSMASCADDVVGGFDNFIKDQKEAEGEAFITLAQFDNLYEMVCENKPISKMASLHFNPRGTTALLDAIGKTINTTKKRIKTTRPGPNSIIFVIITDGQENASVEFKKETISSMIKSCEDELGWKFVYLGANQDSFSEAQSMGIASSGVRNYSSDSKGTKDMWDSVSKGTSNYRARALNLKKNKGDIRTLNRLKYFKD